jgi:hypothetical protein
MYSLLQGIKYCTKKCHFVGTFLKIDSMMHGQMSIKKLKVLFYPMVPDF